jgi:hypothetical protein
LAIAKIEQGMQWAIGDWYNSIPWGDKEAACKEVGLRFNTALTYGNVCAAFPNTDRISNSPFRHYQMLAVQELTGYQRLELLGKASKNGWTEAIKKPPGGGVGSQAVTGHFVVRHRFVLARLVRGDAKIGVSKRLRTFKIFYAVDNFVMV